MPLHKPAQEHLDFGVGDAPVHEATLVSLQAWAPQQWPVAADWQGVLAPFLASKKGCELAQFIAQRIANGAVIYPAQPLWALALSPLAQVRVVILGQDPYHGAGQAQGLAFSVPPHTKTPPSLRNIFKEIERDRLLTRGDLLEKEAGALVSWAKQGVLLLNTVLTVEDGQPASHAGKGWEALTDEIVHAVAEKEAPVVFMLWGKHAQSKIERIASVQAENKTNAHLILTANHPSPLSATRKPSPFLGCGHFSLANDFLMKNGAKAIDWSLPLTK